MNTLLISNYCPAVAGPSVYWARNFRITYEPGITYDDVNCGGTDALRRVNTDWEEEDAMVELFPNPASDRLSILMNSNTYHSFEIIDQMGRLIMKGKVERDVELFGIGLNTLTQGQYILRLKGDEKESSHQFIRAER